MFACFRLFRAYEKECRKRRLLDFDDLLQLAVRLFEKNPAVLREYAARYPHVLVDEYQDLNRAEKELINMLAEAAHSVASPQIRNVGTIGGNLGQRPRCWYYRDEGIQCIKKGGSKCYAAEGKNKYNALLCGGPSYIVHPSDCATALLALNGQVTIAGPGGKTRHRQLGKGCAPLTSAASPAQSLSSPELAGPPLAWAQRLTHTPDGREPECSPSLRRWPELLRRGSRASPYRIYRIAG